MRRYTGGPLPPDSRVAVVANDALGNFVVTTPLLQMLRAAHRPSSLDYFGGKRTEELQEASDLIDRSFVLLGMPLAEALQTAASAGPYDLVVNVENSPFAMVVAALLAGANGSVVGPCAASGGRGTLPFAGDERGALQGDPDWMRPDLQDVYPFLESPWIGEVFCRLAYLDGPIPAYALPSADPGRPIPKVLIATAASSRDKLWPGWEEMVELLRLRRVSVGLLGAPPASQKTYWLGDDDEVRLVRSGLVTDLRGAFSLPEVVGALALAKRVVTLDNGIMHLAAATKTPTVALFRGGIAGLWAPPAANIHPVLPAEGQLVSAITVTEVVGALDALE